MMGKETAEGIIIEGNAAIISVNPDIYPLDAIYTAAYSFLDRAYLFLSGNPGERIKISLRPKVSTGSDDLDGLADEFLDSLINCGFRLKMNEKSLGVKEMLLHEIFDSSALISRQSEKNLPDGLFDEEIDDPEQILVPWNKKQEQNADN